MLALHFISCFLYLRLFTFVMWSVGQRVCMWLDCVALKLELFFIWKLCSENHSALVSRGMWVYITLILEMMHRIVCGLKKVCQKCINCISQPGPYFQSCCLYMTNGNNLTWSSIEPECRSHLTGCSVTIWGNYAPSVYAHFECMFLLLTCSYCYYEHLTKKSVSVGIFSTSCWRVRSFLVH